MFNREQELLKLCHKVGCGEFKFTPEFPEYKMLDDLLTDEEIQLLNALPVMKPVTASVAAALSHMPLKKVKTMLRSLADRLVVPDINLHAAGSMYLLFPFAPGFFEFLLTDDEYLETHPQVAEQFRDHSDTHEQSAATTPMGAGVMRVIPVESALPAKTKKISMERVSYYLETALGYYCALPCQCRRVRRLTGEGTGDLEDGMCLFIGLAAEPFIRQGRGKRLTKEEAYELVKHAEDLGCVHQITTLMNGVSFAICNCRPESCLALNNTQYYNTPELSKSNYVAEVEADKCVACGQCVEVCANNAVKLGQKICSKSPIEYPVADSPADHEWGPERYNPDFRNNKKLVYETGTSPCKTQCPAHIAVQGYIKLASMGKYTEALELIKKENPFPAVCGRICPHTCENECTRGSIDDPIAIDDIKKFIADRELDANQRFIPKKINDFGKKIAVIGSGPAGLSCAYFLAADGYNVTVFEKEMKPGGMLTNGIPSFRLEKDVVDAEIDVLRAMNVKFKCGIEVGKDVTIPQLREEGFEAFYLGIGLQDGGRMNIPGEDAAGVMSGIDFIKKVNRGEDVKLSGKVVVIGGGNIGADIARTAVRCGAESVDLYCLEAFEEMPMGEEDQEYCKLDGVNIHAGWGQTEISKDKSGSCASVTFRKCLSVKNEEGRFDPKFDDKTTETAECTTVLYCIGQKPAWGTILEGINVELDARGLVIADPLTYQTSEPDIFAGGDIYTGQKFAIDAIAAGKQGAISIHRAVWKGHSLTLGRIRNEYKALDKENLDYDEIRKSYDNTSRQKSVITEAKLHTMRDERTTFTEEQLKKETARCLGCGASVVDPNKCLGCGVCTTRCKFDAIHLKKAYDTPVMIPLGITTNVREKAVEKYKEERQKRIAERKSGERK